MKQWITFTSMAAALIGTASMTPVVQARTCSGNGDVVGSYGFVGSRAGYFLLGATAPGTTNAGPLIPVPVASPGTTGAIIPVPVTPPGTTGSNTQIGALVTGLNNRNVFTATGRVFADGMGNLYASSSPGSLTTNTLTGTYTVNTDCSITMTIGDPFVTPGTTIGGIVSATPPVFVGVNSLTLEGAIVDSGNLSEIDVVPTGNNTAGAVVTFTKTAQFGACSNASLSGNYGIVGSGMFSSSAGTGVTTGGTVVATTTTGAFTSGATSPLGTPFGLLGRFVADGGGNLVTDSAGTASTVKRSITGTYLVNADCTGTAHLVDSAAVARNISFVLVNEAGASVQTSARQAILFVFSDPGVIGSGEAKIQ
jgi:hypothetical protein